MAATNDTIKGLLAEFRGYTAGMPDSYHVTMSWADFRKMLDRFDAAHKREIAAHKREIEATAAKCCRLGRLAGYGASEIKRDGEGRRRGMKIVDGKIAKATRDEMFDYYLTRDWDTVMPFEEFLCRCEENGTKIIGKKEGGTK